MIYLIHLTAFICSIFSASVVGYTTDNRWLVPDGSQPDNSITYYTGNSITVSWQTLNSSICDLWFTSADPKNSYAERIATNIDLSTPGTFPWTIDVGTEQININDQFDLRFIPTGTTYEGVDQFVALSSPTFIVLARPGSVGGISSTATTNPENSATSTSAFSDPAASVWTESATTISSVARATTTLDASATLASGSMPTATSANSNSSISASANNGSGISTGVKVGVAIAAVVAACVIIALLLWVNRLRRRVNAASNARSQGIIDDRTSFPKPPLSPEMDVEMVAREKRVGGLHEVHGSKTQPQELSTQKERRSVYEMAG